MLQAWHAQDAGIDGKELSANLRPGMTLGGIEAGRPELRRERGVAEYAQRRRRHFRRAPRRNEEGGRPFLDYKRHATDIGADDGYAARQSFQDRDRLRSGER